jgi:hypothetical protein
VVITDELSANIVNANTTSSGVTLMPVGGALWNSCYLLCTFHLYAGFTDNHAKIVYDWLI